VCKSGAYGDGNDDCKKCPDGMEADKDEDEPGTGDIEDRCMCKNSDWTEWDEDEEKCLCKEGAYMYKDECYECEKGMEQNDDVDGLGDGDIQDRCQCEKEGYFIPDDRWKCEYECPNPNEAQVYNEDECGCKKGYYGYENTCTKCPAGMKGVSEEGVGYGPMADRCECTNPEWTEWDDANKECVCKVGAYTWEDGECYECYKGTEAKQGVGKGNGEFEDRCECEDKDKVISGWYCVAPPTPPPTQSPVAPTP